MDGMKEFNKYNNISTKKTIPFSIHKLLKFLKSSIVEVLVCKYSVVWSKIQALYVEC